MTNCNATAILDRPIQSIAYRSRASEVLCPTATRSFSSCAVVPSNVRAVESCIRFAGGLNDFVAVVGPSGWGKSHLMAAAASQISLEGENGVVQVMNAQEWLSNSRSRSLGGPLILDNAQDLLVKTRSRMLFHMMLERRIRAGKPTLLSFTETKMTRMIRHALPHDREWVHAIIKQPSACERERIVEQIAKSVELVLAPRLVQILASRLYGSGRSILGAVTRLKLIQSSWVDGNEALRACGLLNTFFASNSGWDLREHVADHAKRLAPADWGNVVPFDLAVYVMLKVAELEESSVANYFRIEQSKAYAFATRFDEKVQSDPRIARVAEQFVHTVIANL